MSIYTDPYNARLLIEQSEGAKADVRISCLDGGDVDVPAADLPKIVAALYQAAGQEPPIILDRPHEDDLRAHGWIEGNRVSSATVRDWANIKPGAARRIAACLAAAADIAESEPDPEQVKQLAVLIDPLRSPEATARVILSAGYTRSES